MASYSAGNALPTSLIILIHLHLLSFPSRSSSAYDENLFNPQKHGIGARSRALEDISYFLVSRIEVQRSQAKKILPMYPCLQPSDTLLYRAALTKYLETLRNAVLRPSTSGTASSGLPSTGSVRAHIAWWWRDVIVRKSLLEECAGERFERLLLALSTHALLNSMPKDDDLVRDIAERKQVAVISFYQTTLTSFQSAKVSWERATSEQKQRRQRLNTIRQIVLNTVHVPPSKYATFPLGKLVALSQAVFDDLVQSSWKEEAGRHGLQYLIALADLSREVSPCVTLHASQPPPARGSPVPTAGSTSDIPPLPIAAAHFPSQLKALRNNCLDHPDLEDADSNEAHDINSGDVGLRPIIDRLSVERRVQGDLQTALARAKRTQKDLAARLQAARISYASVPNPSKESLVSYGNATEELDIEEAVVPAISSKPQLHESAVQARVSRIRETLNPSWPPLPDLSSRLPPELEPAPTRLPQPIAQRTITGQQRSKTQVAFSASALTKGGVAESKSKSGAGRKASRKSNALLAGRARRSSAFARRKSLAIDQYEIERIADSFLDESTSDIAISRPHSPTTPHRHAITRGQLLTPRSAIKTNMPRPSFDIGRHERAITTELPRKSLGHDSDDYSPNEEDQLTDGEDEDKVYEGHSLTLKEILLQADETQYDLLQQNELLDDTFEW